MKFEGGWPINRTRDDDRNQRQDKAHASVTPPERLFGTEKGFLYFVFQVDHSMFKILCVQTGEQLLAIFEGGVVPLCHSVRRVIHPCSWAISPNTTSINTSWHYQIRKPKSPECNISGLRCRSSWVSPPRKPGVRKSRATREKKKSNSTNCRSHTA